MWLSSMRCAKRLVIDSLVGAMSEIGRCLMPQVRVSHCGSLMRTIDMAGMQLNALVVERCLRLHTTGPRKGERWCPIRSRARMLIKCASGRHGHLGFIDVRPREPRTRGIITCTNKRPGIGVAYCPLLFIKVGLAAVGRGGGYP